MICVTSCFGGFSERGREINDWEVGGRQGAGIEERDADSHRKRGLTRQTDGEGERVGETHY